MNKISKILSNSLLTMKKVTFAAALGAVLFPLAPAVFSQPSAPKVVKTYSTSADKPKVVNVDEHHRRHRRHRRHGEIEQKGA